MTAKKKVLLALFTLILFPVSFTLSPTPSFAQTNGLDVTNVYEINESEAVEGDIISNTDQGFVRSNFEYDNKIFGVIQQNPLLVFRNVDGSGTPIVRNGNAIVNVTTLNGEIKQGDFITTSTIPGKGTKATRSGYTLGMALQDFNGEGGIEVSSGGKSGKQGQIQVALRIEFTEIDTARNVNRLLEYLDAALFSAVKDPDQFIRMIRYVGSVFVLVATAIFAYLVFARSVSNSIQAIGRNPLARKSIQMAMILNILFSGTVIILGILAAFVLLRA